MGWSPDTFWRAELPEVMGAIIGDENNHIQALRLAWEPARYNAYVVWNAMVDKKGKIKHPQELVRFPWEKKAANRGDANKVIKQAVDFRNRIKDKWGLKYKE